MKNSFALACALAALTTPAAAQDAPAPVATQDGSTAAPVTAADIKRGAAITMTDGRRIGRVDRVRDNSVGFIYNGKYVLLPVSTLTTSSHGLTTSLTKAELAAL